MRTSFWPLLIWALPVLAAPALRLSSACPCVFAGQPAERVVEFGEEVSGDFSWSVHVLPTRRLLMRREQAVERARRIAFSFPVPTLRSGVAMTLEVRGVLKARDGSSAELKERIWALPPKAFSAADRSQLDRELYVLESGDTLTKHLAECGIAPRRVPDPAALATATKGVLLVGPGAQLDRSRLGERLAEAAANGWRVIVLEPAPAQFAFAPSERFSLTTSVAVAKLDKRLWPGFGTQDKGFALSTRRGQVVLELGVDSAKSCWAEFGYASGGSMILTALPVASAWSEGPTARYLLCAMLVPPAEPRASAATNQPVE
jgi:hypothetical protein